MISKCISVFSNKDFTVSDQLLKVLITSSLPSSWDIFIEPYITLEADMPLQEFLEELKLEFHQHQTTGSGSDIALVLPTELVSEASHSTLQHINGIEKRTSHHTNANSEFIYTKTKQREVTSKRQ
jgi:hypothetical protein